MGLSQTMNERNKRTCPSLSGIKFNVIFGKNLLPSLHLTLTLKGALTKLQNKLNCIFFFKPDLKLSFLCLHFWN